MSRKRGFIATAKCLPGRCIVSNKAPEIVVRKELVDTPDETPLLLKYFNIEYNIQSHETNNTTIIALYAKIAAFVGKDGIGGNC